MLTEVIDTLRRTKLQECAFVLNVATFDLCANYNQTLILMMNRLQQERHIESQRYQQHTTYIQQLAVSTGLIVGFPGSDRQCPGFRFTIFDEDNHIIHPQYFTNLWMEVTTAILEAESIWKLDDQKITVWLINGHKCHQDRICCHCVTCMG